MWEAMQEVVQEAIQKALAICRGSLCLPRLGLVETSDTAATQPP
jgi:hypothetical protein